MRVVQVYDIDNKTYLFKLNRSEEKAVLLLESGIRFHTTQYDWPKNIAPSGFSMKMRKHLRNKRLEHICQIGVDRIVDLHFGSGEATYHVILELFDRGNILLTDFTYTILSVLRPHKEGDKFRFAVKEKYPIDRARQESESPSEQFLKDILLPLKEGSSVRKALLPHLEYGSSLLEHVLLMAGFSKYPIMHKDFTLPDIENLAKYCLLAEEIVYMAHKGLLSTGYIIKKKIERINQEDLLKNEEFHPYLFKQHADDLFETFDSFSSAVDEFFSNLEAQKQELKANQITDDALRKVERIREDQQSRLKELNLKQETKVTQAELITHNYKLVDAAIMAVRSALAAQMSWEGIEYLVNDAASKNDPVASIIKKLKLETNHITVLLSDSCIDSEDSERELTQMLVDIDLDLSAHANAKRYYVDKKSAAVKQQKTIESQEKALKSAHKKAMVVMKEVKTMNTISKARKTYWFEKFYWFITSENYLVIGGRDQQQNELIVKRYMRDGDIYVHADIVGASSIIIKNPTGSEVPPKTLNEAGTMAICYSAGWAAKVVCSSWWVHANQVSKTAPTGEYLTTGSFMIRGKKNYLPQSILAMGFTFLFRTDESSAVRHKHEREIRPSDENSRDEERGLCVIVDALNLDSNETGTDNFEGSSSNSSECMYPDSKFSLNFSSNYMKFTGEELVNEETEKNINVTDDVKENELISQQKLESPKITQPNVRELDDILSVHKEPLKQNELDSEEGNTNVEIGDNLIEKEHPLSPSNKKRQKSGPRMRGLIKGEKNSMPNIENKGAECEPGVSERMEQTGKPNLQQEREQHKKTKDEIGFKRGQRSKFKKMKEKYKDQDEEEKELRMSILQSAGCKKKPKKKKAGEVNEPKQNKKPIKVEKKAAVHPQDPADTDEEESEPTVIADLEMLPLLTGQPHPDDELLFAVPVIAPYLTLLNYKYKVKLIPGTSKRGKSAQTCLDIFLRSKDCTQREKDLMRAVNQDTLTRNFPGKVKISTPYPVKTKK